MGPTDDVATVELNGDWRTFDATEDAPAAFAQPDFDDSDWAVGPLSAPSTDVRRFRLPFRSKAKAAQRSWLIVDRASSDANVWIDGTYVGDIDGLIVPTAFEITQQLHARDDHLIALQIPKGSVSAGRDASVKIVETGNIRISRLKILCTDATAEQASLSFSVELDARDTSESLVRIRVGNEQVVQQELQRGLAGGRNRLRWAMTIERPELWWPAGLGRPSLVPVTVEVVDAKRPNTPSDVAVRKIGLREVEIHRGVLKVNGERILVRACRSDALEAAAGFNAILCDDPTTTSKALDFADENGLIAICPVADSAKQVRLSTEAWGHNASLVAWSVAQNHKTYFLPRNPFVQPENVRAIGRADPSRPQLPELPLVKTLGQLDSLRRSRRLLNGYVVDSREEELFAALAAPVRVSFSKRRHPHRRHSQLFDVHLINDSALDVKEARLHANASWTNAEPRHWTWRGTASAGSSAYIGTMSLPREIPATEIHLGWELFDGPETVSGNVTRKVGVNEKINP